MSLPPTFVVINVAGSVVASLHAAPAGPGVMQHHGGQRGEVSPVIDCPEPRVVRPGQGPGIKYVCLMLLRQLSIFYLNKLTCSAKESRSIAS